MENKKYTLKEIYKLVDKAINQAERVNFYTRSNRLQKIEIDNIVDILKFIKNCKYQAINNNEEIIANDFLKMQCILNSYKSSLECWIRIKEGEFQPAWSLLIDAQEYCETATRIFNCEVTKKLSADLKDIEKTIFPSFALYNSIGVLETPGNCSICLKPFNDCEHLENGIYTGRLCIRIDREVIEFNHTALVEVPYDRRCIFTHLEIDGVMVDNFTRDPIEGSEPVTIGENEEGMRGKAILLNVKSLDYD